MLKVKTYTGKDQYGGTGLFAAEDIPQGAVVWTYDPRFTTFISVDEYHKVSPEMHAVYERHTHPIYVPEEGMVGILYNLDDSKYINHSSDPNTGEVGDWRDDVALRPIKKGEEITSNYLTYEPENRLGDMGVRTCVSFLMEHGAFKTQATKSK